MPVYTDPICLLYRVFHETQTAMAMAVVVTMVATVVGAVVHAVKVRISVPSLFCIPERVLYFISKFQFLNSHSFINYFSSIILLCILFLFMFFLHHFPLFSFWSMCVHVRVSIWNFYIYSYDTNKNNKFSAIIDRVLLSVSVYKYFIFISFLIIFLFYFFFIFVN